MTNDGKMLELFVKKIETKLLPENAKITTNEKVYDEDGNQLAEFDIVVELRLGSTNFRWLIECRDRPSSGAQPGSWIEQLIGRKRIHRFDKVIAVSTTGFSPSAISCAQAEGIELREYKMSQEPNPVDWFVGDGLIVYEQKSHLESAVLHPVQGIQTNLINALNVRLSQISRKDEFLLLCVVDEPWNIDLAFNFAVSNVGDFYKSLYPEGGRKTVDFILNYPSDELHYKVKTKCGLVRIQSITFIGEIEVIKNEIQASSLVEYQNVLSGEPIYNSLKFQLNEDGSDRVCSLNQIFDVRKRIHTVQEFSLKKI